MTSSFDFPLGKFFSTFSAFDSEIDRGEVEYGKRNDFKPIYEQRQSFRDRYKGRFRSMIKILSHTATIHQTLHPEPNHIGRTTTTLKTF